MAPATRINLGEFRAVHWAAPAVAGYNLYVALNLYRVFSVSPELYRCSCDPAVTDTKPCGF